VGEVDIHGWVGSIRGFGKRAVRFSSFFFASTGHRLVIDAGGRLSLGGNTTEGGGKGDVGACVSIPLEEWWVGRWARGRGRQGGSRTRII